LEICFENIRIVRNISRSDPATLITYHVTEAGEAIFACKVETNIREWKDEIEVRVVGKSFMYSCVALSAV